MLRMETNTDLRPNGPGSISDNDLDDLFNLDLSSSDFLRQLPASNIDALAEELEVYNGPSSSNFSKSTGGITSFGDGPNLSHFPVSTGLDKTNNGDAIDSYHLIDRKQAKSDDISYPSRDLALMTSLNSDSDFLDSPVDLATSSLDADSSSSHSQIDLPTSSLHSKPDSSSSHSQINLTTSSLHSKPDSSSSYSQIDLSTSSLHSKPDSLYPSYSPLNLDSTYLNADLNMPLYLSTHRGTSSSLNTKPSTSYSSIDTDLEITSTNTPDLFDNDSSLQDAGYRNTYYPSTSDRPKNFTQHWSPHLAGILDEDESVFSNSLEGLNLLNPGHFSSSSLTSNNNKKEIFGTINSEISSVYQYKAKVIDKETVYLKRANSMFDRSGIRVDNKLREQIGVIKREHSPALAYLMDNNLVLLEGKVNYNTECIFRIPLEITVSGNPCKKAEVLMHLQVNSIPFIAHYASPSPIFVAENESPVPFDYDYDHVVSSRTFVTPAEMDNELDKMFKTLDEGDKMTEAESASAVRTPLYPHQKQALNWMICKENNDLLPPFWEKRGKLYLNTLSKKRTPEKPKSIYGGILADDMGLGKTLEMISLILTNFVNAKPLAEPFPGFTRESFNKTSKSGPVRLKLEFDCSKGSPENGGSFSLTNSPPPPKLRLPNRVSPASLSSVSNECQKFYNSLNKDMEKSDFLPSTSEMTHSASFPSFSPNKGLKRSNSDDSDNDSYMSVFSPDKGKGIGKKSKHNNLKAELITDPNACMAPEFIDLTKQGEDSKPNLINCTSAFSTYHRFTSSTPYSEMLALRLNRLRTSAYNVIDVDALPDGGPYEDITPVGSPGPTEVNKNFPEVQEVEDESSFYRLNSDSDTRSCALEPDVFISSSSNKDIPYRDFGGLVKSQSNQMFPNVDTIVISDSEEDDFCQPLDLTKDKLYKKKMSHFTPNNDIQETVPWKKREVTSSTDPATGRTLTNGPRGTLIICPLSVISNWVEQFDEHVDISVKINLHVYYGPKRTFDIEFLSEQDVVITTYATLSSDFKKGDMSPLHRIEWLRIVLDEGHTIRNPAAQQTKAIFELQADRRWVLTGTPIQNSLKDLWSLINFLQVKPFTEKKTWNQIIAGPLIKRERQAMKRVAHLVRNLAMRRTKHQQLNGKPLVSLPARHVYLETVTLNPEERRIYDAMQINGQDLIGSFYQKGTLLNNYGTVLTILLRLRQLCCHPQLVAIGALKKNPEAIFQDIVGGDQKQSLEHKSKLIHQLKTVIESGSDEECSICLESLKEPVITACAHFYCRLCIDAVIEKNEGASCPMCRAPVEKKELYGVEDTMLEAEIEQFHFNPEEWHSSSKVDALMKALNQLRQEDSSIKSVVVSQFTSLLSLLETPLTDQGFKFARLDGTMRANERAKAVHDFGNCAPGSPTIFLLSLKAGGVGINLTAASRVFLLDPAWNPAAEDQCFDRCHRLGQTRDVVITKFVIEDSVEQRMLELQEKKKQLINGVLDKKLSADERRQKRIEEIRTLFNI